MKDLIIKLHLLLDSLVVAMWARQVTADPVPQFDGWKGIQPFFWHYRIDIKLLVTLHQIRPTSVTHL